MKIGGHLGGVILDVKNLGVLAGAFNKGKKLNSCLESYDIFQHRNGFILFFFENRQKFAFRIIITASL
jgi:hypothetical protein